MNITPAAEIRKRQRDTYAEKYLSDLKDVIASINEQLSEAMPNSIGQTIVRIPILDYDDHVRITNQFEIAGYRIISSMMRGERNDDNAYSEFILSTRP